MLPVAILFCILKVRDPFRRIDARTKCVSHSWKTETEEEMQRRPWPARLRARILLQRVQSGRRDTPNSSTRSISSRTLAKRSDLRAQPRAFLQPARPRLPASTLPGSETLQRCMLAQLVLQVRLGSCRSRYWARDTPNASPSFTLARTKGWTPGKTLIKMPPVCLGCCPYSAAKYRTGIYVLSSFPDAKAPNTVSTRPAKRSGHAAASCLVFASSCW